jgi:chromosome segregation protein
VYLKQLDLVGFKSFAGKTSFAFEPGITVMCGPNGSGKSNVADAIRWVLGEQSARAVRGRKGEDVIFVGGQGRHAMGMAEVSLILDNADGRIPLDYADVRVTRRLFRGGDTEYLANGSRVRLRDIQNWLFHAALDTDAYVVVGQGSVDELILQRPEDRRAVLDNAADIRRHHSKLSETRNKLSATEEQLLRCHAVIAELEPHVIRLRAQSERADRYHACRAELAGLTKEWLRHSLAAANRSATEAQREAAEARAAVAAVDTEQSALEDRLSALAVRIATLDDELAERESAVNVARAEAAEVSRELAIVDERHRVTLTNDETLQREIQGLTERSGVLDVDLAEVAGRRNAVRLDLAQATTALEEAAALESTRSAARRSALDALQRIRQETSGAAARLASARQALSEARRRSESADQRLRELTERVARLAEQRRSVDARAAELDATAATAAGALRDARQLRDRLDAQRRELRSRLDTLRQQGLDLTSRRQSLEIARRAAEEALLANANQGVGVLLQRGGDRVLGVLAAHLRVPPNLQRAIGAALGTSAQTVLVRQADEAVESVALLLRERADRTAIHVMENKNGISSLAADFKRASASALDGLTVEGYAGELIAAPDGMGSTLDYYLGAVLVVRDLDAAREIADRLTVSPAAHLPWQVVTLDGHAIRWCGEWSAGRDHAAEKLIARQDELARLDEQLARLAPSIAAVESDLTESEASLAQVDRDERSLRDGMVRAEQQDRRAALEAQAGASEAKRLHDEHARLEETLPREREQIERVRAASDEQAARVASLEAESGAAVDRLASAERAEQEARDATEALRLRLAELRADVANRRAALQAEDNLVGRLETEGTRIAHELASARERADSARQSAARLVEERARMGQRLAATRTRLAPLETDVAARRDARRADAAERARLDEQLGSYRARSRSLRTVLDAAAIEESRAVDRVERLRREAQEWLDDAGLGELYGEQELGPLFGVKAPSLKTEGRAGERVGLGEASFTATGDVVDGANCDPPLPLPEGRGSPHRVEDAEQPLDETFDAESTRKRMLALRRELRQIGHVSEDTLREFQELSSRHAFLTDQAVDLEKAIAELRGAMGELEAIMRDAFGHAFATVNGHFAEYFARLFGSGHAELVLTKPDNALESGVDIVARPPGKRLQPLVSLSGGERALTMIALIFALLKTNPSPFCVLDEVDAALDESNVRRFTGLLTELSDRTQFVVVTHNRATMEIAKSIYGISMDASGVSTVVSLKLPTD